MCYKVGGNAQIRQLAYSYVRPFQEIKLSGQSTYAIQLKSMEDILSPH